MNKVSHAFNPEKSEEIKQIHRRSNIGTGIVAIIIILILLYPFFKTQFPIPEAEGLMVAFGDNLDAGGAGEINSTPYSPPPPPPQPVQPDKIEEKATVEDKDDPIVIKPTEKPKTPTPPQPTTPSTNTTPNPTPAPPQPQVNTDALFPGMGGGTGNGTGTGNGSGKQGAPDGVGDLGGTGRGNQGNGTGAVGNRHIKQKCTSVVNDTNWDEEGVAWIFICVNEQGKVTEAAFQKNTSRGEISTITSQYQRNLAEKCAKEYTYDSALGQGTACGSIPIYFKKQ